MCLCLLFKLGECVLCKSFALFFLRDFRTDGYLEIPVVEEVHVATVCFALKIGTNLNILFGLRNDLVEPIFSFLILAFLAHKGLSLAQSSLVLQKSPDLLLLGT